MMKEENSFLQISVDNKLFFVCLFVCFCLFVYFLFFVFLLFDCIFCSLSNVVSALWIHLYPDHIVIL